MSDSMMTIRDGDTGHMRDVRKKSVLRLEPIFNLYGEHTQVYSDEGYFRAAESMHKVASKLTGKKYLLIPTHTSDGNSNIITGYASIRHVVLMSRHSSLSSNTESEETWLRMTDGSICATHEKIPALIALLSPFSQVVDIQLPQLSDWACIVARHVESIDEIESVNICNLSMSGGVDVVVRRNVDRLRDAIMVANGGKYLKYSRLEWMEGHEDHEEDSQVDLGIGKALLSAGDILRTMLAGDVPSREDMETVLHHIDAAASELRKEVEAPHP